MQLLDKQKIWLTHSKKKSDINEYGLYDRTSCLFSLLLGWSIFFNADVNTSHVRTLNTEWTNKLLFIQRRVQTILHKNVNYKFLLLRDIDYDNKK